METAASDTVETAASGTMETAASGTMEAAASETVETAASDKVETAASGTMETAASDTVEIAAGDAVSATSHHCIATFSESRQIRGGVPESQEGYGSGCTTSRGNIFVERCTPHPRPESLGRLRDIPHDLLGHVLAGLPQPTIMALSRSSRHCRQVAREAILRKRGAILASVRGGCWWASAAQLRVLLTLLERFVAFKDPCEEGPVELDELIWTLHGVSPDGKVSIWRTVNDITVSFTVLKLLGNGEEEEEEEDRQEWWLEFYDKSPLGLRLLFKMSVAAGTSEGGLAACVVQRQRDVEMGQALLLLFQESFKASNVSFTAPITSLCECAVLIPGCEFVSWWKQGSETPAKTYDFAGQVWPETRAKSDFAGHVFLLCSQIWLLAVARHVPGDVEVPESSL
eukprot:jgi/Botrbrau1/16318/Bobra.0066s0086.1